VSGVVFWDFDGTLAHRPGMWSACMVETLDEHEPGHAATLDVVRPLLQDGFPWHAPGTPHPELCDADAWWEHVGELLARAYERLGHSRERSVELARHARVRYVDAQVGWTVFDDSVPALERLRLRGWRHVLLSNHVPELPSLVRALGLDDWFDAVLTSAATGYEKPHPEMYALALRAAGAPDRAWMIGDNYDADVAGAEAVGIPAVLVRRDDARAERSVATLDELDRYVA
jgi:putative hydrolase of the HAD superfamily